MIVERDQSQARERNPGAHPASTTTNWLLISAASAVRSHPGGAGKMCLESGARSSFACQFRASPYKPVDLWNRHSHQSSL